MTDSELLECAAQAVGLRLTWETVHNCYWISAGQGLEVRPWNPLTDDGDALRLAVKLQIFLAHHHHGIGWVDAGLIKELIGTDPYAATRRAIVRAAAGMVVTQ